MGEEKKFIYRRESLIQSVLSDTYSMVILVASVWFNYNFVGNSKFLNGVILVLFILFLIGREMGKSKTFYNKEDLLNYLKKEEK